MIKKHAIITAIAIVVIGILIFPFKTVMVPEWKVRVVDEKGIPYKQKLVRQFCDNYTLDLQPCSYSPDSAKYTDDDGYITFPERAYSTPLLLRAFLTAKSLVMVLAHGSLGTSVYIDSSGPNGYKTLRYQGAGKPPDILVLPSGE